MGEKSGLAAPCGAELMKVPFMAAMKPFCFFVRRKLLRRKVENRLGTSAGAEAVKAHRFFSSVDWRMVAEKRYPPPHIPSFSNRSDATDVSQFDPRFTSKTPRESEVNET